MKKKNIKKNKETKNLSTVGEKVNLRQKKLISLIMENYGKGGKGRRSLGSILLEAGYSPSSAKNPKTILEGSDVKEAIDDLLEMFDIKRRQAMNHITEKKMIGARITDLVYLTDSFTKNHQLLSGKDTARHGFNLTPEQQKEIDDILEENSN